MKGQRWTVEDTEAGIRLDKFLAAAQRLRSRPRATAALERGKVYLNETEVGITDAARRVMPGDVVALWMDRPGSASRRPRTGRRGALDVIYEDDALIAVNKPAGLLTVPLERKGMASSVYRQISDRDRSHGKRRPFVVHRIDQDTSGIVVFAKDAAAQRALQAQFKRREPDRVYRAVVHGRVQPEEGSWRDHLVWDEKALVQKRTSAGDPRGTEAICEYSVLEAFDRASLIEVRLRTGRRNQIRIQASLRGYPLVGERRYVAALPPDAIPFGRQALHAHRLAFAHPVDGRPLRLEAALPPDFQDLLARLRARRLSPRGR